MRLLGFLAAILLANPLAACAAGGRVTNLYAIPLEPGANTISRFAPDGRHAVVVEGTRGAGAQLHRVFLVMLPGAPKVGGWNVVPVRLNALDSAEEVLRDDLGGVRSLRFARGKLDGIPETFQITAERDTAGRAPVTFSLFRLAAVREGGAVSDSFVPVRQIRSRETFCNTDAAIARQFHLPLPASYTGPATPDGCQTRP
jgi:hypothetical protein